MSDRDELIAKARAIAVTGGERDITIRALADLAESEGRRADRESETLLKIAAAFNGWANAGPPDGGPSNAITAATVLEKIGEALGDPLKGQQP